MPLNSTGNIISIVSAILSGLVLLGVGLIRDQIVDLGRSADELGRTVAAQAQQIEGIKDRISSATEDRYRAGDARRDFAVRDAVINQLRKDIDRMQDEADRERRTEEWRKRNSQ